VKPIGGGLRLVALTVLTVCCFALPASAKHEPGQGPPGQEKKDKKHDQQAAAAPTPAADQAPSGAEQPAAAAPAPPDKHAAKQQAKAEKKAAKQEAKAEKHADKQPSKTVSQTTTDVTPTSSSPGRRKKTAASTTPAPAPAVVAAAEPAAAPAAPAPAAAPVTHARKRTGRSAAQRRAAARKRHRAAVRRANAGRRTAARRARPVAPVARPLISTTAPLAAISPGPAKPEKKAAKETDRRAPSHQPDDQPNVVLRTVSDVVEVVPTPLWVLLGILTGLSCLFAVTSARQTRRAHRLAAERGTLLGDVGVLQDAVLPVVPPRVGSLAVSVAHRPAGGPAAGGDFYDVVALDNGRSALVVGDVSGHGPGALGHATLVRFTLRAHLESGAGPREALAIAASSLAPHFEEGFATAAVAIHDPREGTLTYATAAHEAPIVVGPGSHAPVIASSTPPLGIGANGPLARRQTTVPFPEGSLACMLTDGALEARHRGELVGRARVEEWVREMGARPAAGDMAELIRTRAAVSDDLAVCFATSTAGPDTGSWRIEELNSPTPAEAERFLVACGAGDDLRGAVAEALRFTHAGTVLSVRFEDDRVVSADVAPSGKPAPVAA
jgi:hypothetical protein